MTPRSLSKARELARGARHDETGISLVELLVAIMVFGILITLVSSMYVSMSRTVTTSNARNDSTKSGALAMNELTRVIRFAANNTVAGNPLPDPAFVAAGRESLTIYSYVDTNAAAPQPVEVAFALDGQRRIVETRYPAIAQPGGLWTFSSTAASTRILTGTIVAQSGTEPYLFTYLTSDGTPIPTPAAGLAASQFGAIAAVQVTAKVRGDVAGAQPVVFQNVVGLPNLGINRTGQ